MPNILSSLLTSAGALQAYDRVLQATQNNVSNASTPGYAKHSVPLTAMQFDPESGDSGSNCMAVNGTLCLA